MAPARTGCGITEAIGQHRPPWRGCHLRERRRVGTARFPVIRQLRDAADRRCPIRTAARSRRRACAGPGAAAGRAHRHGHLLRRHIRLSLTANFPVSGGRDLKRSAERPVVRTPRVRGSSMQNPVTMRNRDCRSALLCASRLSLDNDPITIAPRGSDLRFCRIEKLLCSRRLLPLSQWRPFRYFLSS